MDAPDFQVTPLLVDSEFFRHVVVAGRARPDLDNERERLVIDLEDILLIEEWGHEGRWNDEDIRDEVGLIRTAHSS